MEYFSAGEKKLKEWSFFDKEKKYSDAAELFKKAANKFKIERNMEKAVESHSKTAELHLKLNEQYEAASEYVSIYKLCYHEDPMRASDFLEKAVTIYLNDGKFGTAANHLVSIAEIHEENNDYVKSIDYYQRAADIFQIENNTSRANKCLLKIADQCSIHSDNYAKSIDIYESVAKSFLKNNLLKWGVTDIYVKAGLLYLCNTDLIRCREQIKFYCDSYPNFSSSREHDLLVSVANAYGNYDIDSFMQTIYEYDKIKRLDDWKVKILNKIKKSIARSSVNFEDDDSIGLA